MDEDKPTIQTDSQSGGINMTGGSMHADRDIVGRDDIHVTQTILGDGTIVTGIGDIKIEHFHAPSPATPPHTILPPPRSLRL